MACATLTVDLSEIAANWRALDQMSSAETAAVIKADGYGLGANRIARRLAQEGARKFFVAATEEGAALRAALGPGPEIYVLTGHMAGDTDMISDLSLIPVLNSVDQLLRHFEALTTAPFGIQLDTGMNRLGLEPAEWRAVRDLVVDKNPALVISHLACADEPDHAMNDAQLRLFQDLTADLSAPKSLAATGGILLGRAYHFDLTRPGIGLYGGLPFIDARPVARIDVPVIQVRDVVAGESVGYGNAWVARAPSRVATIAAGYGDGILRAMGPKAHVWAGETRCKMIGRISMDLIGVDVTQAREVPDSLELLGPHQSVDTLAEAAGTIGYEILTSLGTRYQRRYRP